MWGREGQDVKTLKGRSFTDGTHPPFLVITSPSSTNSELHIFAISTSYCPLVNSLYSSQNRPFEIPPHAGSVLLGKCEPRYGKVQRVRDNDSPQFARHQGDASASSIPSRAAVQDGLALRAFDTIIAHYPSAFTL
jgi:hypothetical protein